MSNYQMSFSERGRFQGSGKGQMSMKISSKLPRLGLNFQASIDT